MHDERFCIKNSTQPDDDFTLSRSVAWQISDSVRQEASLGLAVGLHSLPNQQSCGENLCRV